MLTPYELGFWTSFGLLGTMRPAGMGLSAIPWDKIIAYADYNHLTRTETSILVRVIRNMDAAFISAVNKKNAANT